MDFDKLTLPPPDSKFIGGRTDRSHRSHFAAGFTLEEVRYNCRLTEARRLAVLEAATTRATPASTSTPVRDAHAKILALLQ